MNTAKENLCYFNTYRCRRPTTTFFVLNITTNRVDFGDSTQWMYYQCWLNTVKVVDT